MRAVTDFVLTAPTHHDDEMAVADEPHPFPRKGLFTYTTSAQVYVYWSGE